MAVDNTELVGVKDEYGQTVVEAQAESLKHQQELYEKSIENVKQQKQDYLEQVAIDDEAWQIRLAEPGKMEDKKVFNYEKNPRYWELVHKKMEYEYRAQRAQVESTLQGFDHRISTMEGELASVREKISAMESDSA